MSENILKIGVSQIPNSKELNQNLLLILQSILSHQENGSDLLLFPECSLTGFNPSKDLNSEEVNSALELILSECTKHSMVCVVPTILRVDDKFYNCAVVFKESSIQIVFKEGLTASEKTYFSSRNNNKRTFTIKGFEAGLITCCEIQEEPFKYFSSNSLPDLVLWPGYWGWDKEVNWKKESKEYGYYNTVKAWQRILIQSNFSFNAFDNNGKPGPQGRSVVINHKSELFHSAPANVSSDYQVLLKPIQGRLHAVEVKYLEPNPT